MAPSCPRWSALGLGLGLLLATGLLVANFLGASRPALWPYVSQLTPFQGNAASSGRSWLRRGPVGGGHPLFDRIAQDLAPFVESNITLQMVEQAYCFSSNNMGFRFQIINGSAYVAGEAGEWQSRLENMKRQLLEVHRRYTLPDLDVVIEQADWPSEGRTTDACPQRGPIIAATKTSGHEGHRHVVLAPDHTFGSWIESRTLPWREMHSILMEGAKDDFPWPEKLPTAMFRGAPTGSVRGYLGGQLWDWAMSPQDPAKPKGPANWERNPPPFDVRIEGDIHLNSHFMSVYEHCKYKYLLHIPGNSYSARLKYLLGCGSVVVVMPSEFEEFWYHLMKHNENVFELDFGEEGAQAGPAQYLADKVQYLRDHDDEARRIGDAARTLIQRSLSPEMVLSYWAQLLQRYAQLMTFRPTLHPDAIPLEDAVLARRNIDWSERTCTLC